MTDKRFYGLALISLAAMVTMAFLGAFLESIGLLFNVLLTVIGIIAGYLTNHYFAAKSERQNLGRYASAGNRLSLDIYDSLKGILEEIEKMKISSSDSDDLPKRHVDLMLDRISGELQVLQRFSLLANNQWRDVLPPDRLLELSNREKRIALSEDREVQITEVKHIIQR
jgi:hypothetical protein